MNNSLPKIVYNEECIDLRNHLEKDIKHSTHNNLNLNPYQKEWNSMSRTKNERNEIVNSALKKLAKSYNASNAPFEKKNKTRTKENSFYDPYRKKFSDSPDTNSLKSKSELSTQHIKENKYSKVISPSSPTIQCTYQKGDFQRKIEPFRNKFTMTKMNPENKEEKLRHGKNLKRDTSIDKLIHRLIKADQLPAAAKNDNNPVWKDQRLSEKYSLLKLPWKRSYTLPICSQPSILVKEEYKKKLIDNSDKRTYLYDDGSEADSTYFEPKLKQNFGYILQNQVLMLLNISAYVCAILVISLIVWFISGNKFVYKWLIPKPPEDSFKKYVRLVGGSVIYALTSVISFIGRIFAIPLDGAPIHNDAPVRRWPNENFQDKWIGRNSPFVAWPPRSGVLSVGFYQK